MGASSEVSGLKGTKGGWGCGEPSEREREELGGNKVIAKRIASPLTLSVDPVPSNPPPACQVERARRETERRDQQSQHRDEEMAAANRRIRDLEQTVATLEVNKGVGSGISFDCTISAHTHARAHTHVYGHEWHLAHRHRPAQAENAEVRRQADESVRLARREVEQLAQGGSEALEQTIAIKVREGDSQGGRVGREGEVAARSAASHLAHNVVLRFGVGRMRQFPTFRTKSGA